MTHVDGRRRNGEIRLRCERPRLDGEWPADADRQIAELIAQIEQAAY